MFVAVGVSKKKLLVSSGRSSSTQLKIDVGAVTIDLSEVVKVNTEPKPDNEETPVEVEVVKRAEEVESMLGVFGVSF